ncbi:hypothetical protein M422DRAFT_778942 [Sphaerobolus stellatus SS14]|uniref:Uncharacterized protein n=1 Tax=Sphaerobolus stellatus (strain SS14) TaxID=990650 RepID=A0A0C9W1C7_SPHS4|nr:hypothetical protein M422DRAFT_778942 [Sphaerobolus stellatus SS14]
MTLLAVCHTIIPEIKEDGSIKYQASSPDEAALVAVAEMLGYRFHTCKPKSVFVDINGPYTEKATQHLEDDATEGLRTLCIASRTILEEEYGFWSVIYDQAAITINGRGEAFDKVAKMIERDMLLLGATAIEDKLQEGVPDSLTFALEKELSKQFQQLAIMCKAVVLYVPASVCLVRVSHHIPGRVSPLQKALVVKLVKKNLKSILLSLGDGACWCGHLRCREQRILHKDVVLVMDHQCFVSFSDLIQLLSDHVLGRFQAGYWSRYWSLVLRSNAVPRCAVDGPWKGCIDLRVRTPLSVNAIAYEVVLGLWPKYTVAAIPRSFVLTMVFLALYALIAH